jgi:hypothetical protein
VQSAGQFVCDSPDRESQNPSLLHTEIVGAAMVGLGTDGPVGATVGPGVGITGLVGCVGCTVGTTGWTGQSCKGNDMRITSLLHQDRWRGRGWWARYTFMHTCGHDAVVSPRSALHTPLPQKQSDGQFWTVSCRLTSHMPLPLQPQSCRLTGQETVKTRLNGQRQCLLC